LVEQWIFLETVPLDGQWELSAYFFYLSFISQEL